VYTLNPLACQNHAKLFVSQNLTLRFFTTSQADSCDYGSSSQALTFTTGSVPIVSKCFELADLFNGNASSGFVNQTWNQPNVWGEAGIHWTLTNKDAFDASANYSSILYRQSSLSPNNDGQKSGDPANIRATIYPGERCTEKDPNDNSTEGLLPWYGFGCFSEEKGRCGTTPYNIVSFRITPGVEDKEKNTCWDFARNGQSGAARLPKSVLAAVVGAGLATLFIL
jgi:hypothetical protein